ncbi:MAG: flagellar protein FliT [Gammaproteobacteria bacterium]|nr:flagellar protein FliT [Gammaproteobacteria bacterium]
MFVITTNLRHDPLDTHRQQHWQAILDKTRQMYELARNEQWQRLTDMEAERHEMIESFFSIALSPDEAVVIADGIRQILHSDRNLNDMAVEFKSQAIKQLSGLANARNAIQAYDNCSTSDR